MSFPRGGVCEERRGLWALGVVEKLAEAPRSPWTSEVEGPGRIRLQPGE